MLSVNKQMDNFVFKSLHAGRYELSNLSLNKNPSEALNVQQRIPLSYLSLAKVNGITGNSEFIERWQTKSLHRT